MPISTAIPLALDLMDVLNAIQEILRRGVDGTVVPLVVDSVNQRVIIGGTSVSASPAKIEVASGDIKVVTGGRGIILPCRNGTNYGRVILENPDASGNIVISVDPL